MGQINRLAVSFTPEGIPLLDGTPLEPAEGLGLAKYGVSTAGLQNYVTPDGLYTISALDIENGVSFVNHYRGEGQVSATIVITPETFDTLRGRGKPVSFGGKGMQGVALDTSLSERLTGENIYIDPERRFAVQILDETGKPVLMQDSVTFELSESFHFTASALVAAGAGLVKSEPSLHTTYSIDDNGMPRIAKETFYPDPYVAYHNSPQEAQAALAAQLDKMKALTCQPDQLLAISGGEHVEDGSHVCPGGGGSAERVIRR